MAGKLHGKVAVITGTGGPGMGRAAALSFAREGARIVGCDVNQAGAQETVRLVEQAGGTMISLQPADLMDEATVQNVMDTANREFGGIDILYANAASVRTGTAMRISSDDFRYSLDGTITMTWMAVKAAVPYMEKRGGGTIINVSSVTGHPVGAGSIDNFNVFFAYGVGKAGIIRMTQLLAIDLAEKNIRVNCISPGAILPNAAPMLGTPGSALHDAWLKSFLVKRPGTAEDVANTALFLASDDAAYITGQDIVVDGGLCIGGYQGSPLQRGLYDQALVDAASAPQRSPLAYAKE